MTKKKRPMSPGAPRPKHATKYAADVVITFQEPVAKIQIKALILNALSKNFNVKKVTVRSVDFD